MKENKSAPSPLGQDQKVWDTKVSVMFWLITIGTITAAILLVGGLAALSICTRTKIREENNDGDLLLNRAIGSENTFSSDASLEPPTWLNIGKEYQFTELACGDPKVKFVDENKFALTYSNQNGNGKLYLRLFNISGSDMHLSPITSPIQVEDGITVSGRQDMSVATTKDGGKKLIIIWNSKGLSDIYLRYYDLATESFVTEPLVANNFKSGTQWFPAVISFPDGYSVSAWENTGQTPNKISAQFHNDSNYSSLAKEKEFILTPDVSIARIRPDLIGDKKSNSTFYLLTTTMQGGNYLKLRRCEVKNDMINPDINCGKETQIGSTSVVAHHGSSLLDGKIFLVWSPSPGTDLIGGCFDQDKNQIGNNFVINELNRTGIVYIYSGSARSKSNENYTAVVWQQKLNETDSSEKDKIFTRFYHFNDTINLCEPVTHPFLISEDKTVDQISPSIDASNGNNTFVFAWAGGEGSSNFYMKVIHLPENVNNPQNNSNNTNPNNTTKPPKPDNPDNSTNPNYSTLALLCPLVAATSATCILTATCILIASYKIYKMRKYNLPFFKFEKDEKPHVTELTCVN